MHTFSATKTALDGLFALGQNASLLMHQREFADSKPFLIVPSAKRSFRAIKGHYQELGRTKREFDYKSIVITLYGIVEAFVEDIIDEYIREIADLSDLFSDLPKSIRTKHQELCIRLSARLLQSPDLAQITVSQVIQGAHEAESENLAKAVVTEAFSSHTANVRSQVVDLMFSNIGIDKLCARSFGSPSFQDISKRSDFSSEIVIGTDGRLIQLDDLCLQRNFVAHGRASNIIAIEGMLPLIKFVEAFCAGTDYVLRQETNKENIVRFGEDLGDNVKYFPNMETVGFPLLLSALSPGDILGRSSTADGGRYDFCRIDQVRVEGNIRENAEPGDKNVTLKITPFLAGRAKYVIIKRSRRNSFRPQ